MPEEWLCGCGCELSGFGDVSIKRILQSKETSSTAGGEY